MRKKRVGLAVALSLTLLGKPSHAESWMEITVEADSSYKLYVDMDSIRAVDGFGGFSEKRKFVTPQRAPGVKQVFTEARAAVVVDCEDETLAYTGVVYYSAKGDEVGSSRLPSSRWHFFEPPLGSGGNQEMEVVCASLDSKISLANGSSRSGLAR